MPRADKLSPGGVKLFMPDDFFAPHLLEASARCLQCRGHKCGEITCRSGLKNASLSECQRASTMGTEDFGSGLGCTRETLFIFSFIVQNCTYSRSD